MESLNSIFTTRNEVSHRGVSVHGGGGISGPMSFPGGCILNPFGAGYVQGVGIHPQMHGILRDTVNSGRNASYWNAFLLHKIVQIWTFI